MVNYRKWGNFSKIPYICMLMLIAMKRLYCLTFAIYNCSWNEGPKGIRRALKPSEIGNQSSELFEAFENEYYGERIFSIFLANSHKDYLSSC